MLYALAAMRTAANDDLLAGPVRSEAVQLVVSSCRDAASACRDSGLNPDLLHCAGALDRAADVSEAMLAHGRAALR